MQAVIALLQITNLNLKKGVELRYIGCPLITIYSKKKKETKKLGTI